MKLSAIQLHWLRSVADRKDGIAVMEGRDGGYVENFFARSRRVAEISTVELNALKRAKLYRRFHITPAGRAALEDADTKIAKPNASGGYDPGDADG